MVLKFGNDECHERVGYLIRYCFMVFLFGVFSSFSVAEPAGTYGNAAIVIQVRLSLLYANRYIGT